METPKHPLQDYFNPEEVVKLVVKVSELREDLEAESELHRESKLTVKELQAEVARLKEERDKLKKDVKILEGDFESLIKQKCGYIRACKRYEDDIERLEKGLPRLTRDEHDKRWPISSKWDEVETEFIARKGSNDKQATPAEKADNTPYVLECLEGLQERLAKIEKAFKEQLRIEL